MYLETKKHQNEDTQFRDWPLSFPGAWEGKPGLIWWHDPGDPASLCVPAELAHAHIYIPVWMQEKGEPTAQDRTGHT